MLALLLLPILTSGFYLCNNNPKLFYRLHRFEGQHLYFVSAWQGVKCLFWTLLLALVCTNFIPSTLFHISINLFAELDALTRQLVSSGQVRSQLNWLIILGIGMHVVAWLRCIVNKFVIYVLSKWHKRDAHALLMLHILKDSPLDRELLKSAMESQAVLITLSNRKVYVGIVSSMGEPTETEGPDQEISIVPLKSGYRDPVSQTVTLVTDYEKLPLESDLQITIRQELIESIAPYDEMVFELLAMQDSGIKQPKLRVTIDPLTNKMSWDMQ